MGDAVKKQSLLFRGIYEFEDPSGSLVAAKVPSHGSVDLYDGTVVVVRPAQFAMFIYQGKIADVYGPGTHSLNTGNAPILTRLANFALGFQSPLRCELVFFSTQNFLSRRWGTAQPVLTTMDGIGPVPLRAFGSFNARLANPTAFFTKVFGTRSTFSVADLDEFIQARFAQSLPAILQNYRKLDQLPAVHAAVSQAMQNDANAMLINYGIQCDETRVMSLLPSREVLDAMEAKAAISLIGSQRDYLAYKAANSLDQPKQGGGDPMQMMLGLVLGKGLLQPDSREALPVSAKCACGTALASDARFCSSCGKPVKT